MKIFVFSGSNKISGSNTETIIKEIIDKIKGTGEEVVTYMYSPSNIKSCIGCTSCFNTGKCVLEDQDNISNVIDKLKESDVIIIGSPVYFHNVTGGMKNFIDRLSYLSYVFLCKAKIAVTVSTSGTNGNEFVDSYLEKFLSAHGATTVKKVSLKLALMPQQVIDDEIKDASDKIMKVYKDKTLIKSNDIQEACFANYKKIFSMSDESLYCVGEWKRNGYFECDSFQELIDKNILKGENLK